LRFDAPFKAMVVSYSGNLGHRWGYGNGRSA
jgi:hypothetical protein